MTLLAMVRDPLLAKFFGRPPAGILPNGMAGLNRGSFRIIEEQRIGTDWITSGLVQHNSDYIAQGWKALDLGLEFQDADGGFGPYGYYHSNSLFVEALARAILLDPSGKTRRRMSALEKASGWLLKLDAKGREWNSPYTHRSYIVACALGFSGALLSRQDLLDASD
ncbi:MAG: hypothetical protein WA085_08095, partial [Sphingobium sp.]